MRNVLNACAIMAGVAAIFFPTAPALAAAPPAADSLTAVPFTAVHIADAFWSPRLAINRTATIEANLRQCEVTGRIQNFAVAGKRKPGKHQGALYNDSDLYKAIEAIAYILSNQRDAALAKRADDIIDLIAAAQQPDGYLNTYYTLVAPQERWKNIAHGHELYCAGHLFEAAVAYQQATGKRQLLDVAIKLADHICATFGPGKKIDTSGHEEIELALVKLYQATKNKRYLEQAKFFVDVRGRADLRRLFGEYAQDHKPVREQSEVTGHAVRATYLYCGMADVAALTGDAALHQALEKIWRDVVERKMYLTGGIGPSAHNEGFTVPYDLPNDSAYAETCAAIGLALWNQRMFLLSGEGKYADVLERVVYNGLLSGVSLGGDRFFYTNPLGSKGRHQRVEWFHTACCPPNVARYVPAIGERIYAQRDDNLWTVLYAGNTATVQLKSGQVKLHQETKYPWEGTVQITVTPAKPLAFTLHLRVPGWCRGPVVVTVNGAKIGGSRSEKGFIPIARTWQAGDVVRLELPMPVERVYAHPKVKANVGRVALQRGPIVYCLEGVDNQNQVRNLFLPRHVELNASFAKDVLGGVVTVRGQAMAKYRADEDTVAAKPFQFLAVPYATWANRKPGPMVVWLPETAELAEIPGEEGVQSKGILVRASHLWVLDKLTALNDGQLPKSSKDHAIPRMTWWDRRGSTEWVSYRFPQARKVDRAAVYWFDDTGIGGCRIPAEWRLFWLDANKEWHPVKLATKSTYGTALDRLNSVTFEPITTRELKLEVKLRPGFSGGILEWAVE